MKKITKAQMYTIIMDGIETGDFAVSVDEIKDFCAKEIESLNKKSANSNTAAARKREEETIALTNMISAVLDTEEYKTIAEIAEELNDESMTPQRITYRLKQLIDTGNAEKLEVSRGTRKVMGYKLVAVGNAD